MNTLLISLAAVLGGLLAVLLALALWSRFGQAPGLVNGQLAPCPGTPNCVCSEAGTDSAHVVAALPLPADGLARLQVAIEAAGGRVEAVADDYLAASFRSALFGFVDDLEIRIDRAAGVAQVRSAARVGYSDGGVNRRRVVALRERLAAGH